MVLILRSRCQQLPSPVVASACAVSDVLPHCTDGRCCLSQCMISPDFSLKKKKGHHHTAMHLQSCSIGRRESLVTVTHGLGALRLTATPQFFLLSKVSSFHWRRKCSWFCFFFSSTCFDHKCVLCIFLYVSVQAPRVISWCPCFVQMGD